MYAGDASLPCFGEEAARLRPMLASRSRTACCKRRKSTIMDWIGSIAAMVSGPLYGAQNMERKKSRQAGRGFLVSYWTEELLLFGRIQLEV